MRLFEQYFTLPFLLDIWGEYVFDDKGHMMLQFNANRTGWQDVDHQEQVVDWLNNVLGTTKPKVGTLQYDQHRVVITEDNLDWIDIRGWGYLTGVGGLNLSDEEATEIQDSLAEYIIEKLTKK